MMTFRTALPRSLARAFFILGAASVMMPVTASAKAPGATYCFFKTCHRVKSLAETRALIGQEHTLPASFYDSCKSDPYNPCGLTSSGEVFRPNDADNAASPIYPDGTTLLVWAPATKQAAVLRVNNAGPYWGDRKLDVSRAAAEKLGFEGRGVASLKAQVLSVPTQGEATYSFKRHYQPVLGHIGQFASLDEAAVAVAALNPTTPGVDQAEEQRLIAILRPALKSWPVIGQSMTQLAITKSAAMKWPVVAIAEAKRMPPVGISKTVAIKWPVVGADRAKSKPVQIAAAPVLKKIAASNSISETAPRAIRRAETWSQQVAKAKQRRIGLAAVKSVKPRTNVNVAKLRIKPSRGLAAAVRAEEAQFKAKNLKLRIARQQFTPAAKRATEKLQTGKSADAKKPVKVSFADPDAGLSLSNRRLTGRGPKLPQRFVPVSGERKLQKPFQGPRLIQKALA